MKTKLLHLTLLLLPTLLQAQTATFSADTTRFAREMRKDIYDKIMEAEWHINGQTLRYGGAPVVVATDEVLDTILYKQRNNAPTDTIICMINRPGNYTFLYNDCCGGFNIADASGKFIDGTVQFKLLGADTQKQYLGTLGESGMLVTNFSTDTLHTGCRSALSPNIYPITFSEIDICVDTINCTEGTCLYEAGKAELNYDFGFHTRVKLLNCLYMPLSNQPIQVVYEIRTGRVWIE